MLVTMSRIQSLFKTLPVIFYSGTYGFTQCDNNKSKEIIEKINNIKNKELLNKINTNVNKLIEFDNIKTSNINGNFKTFFCHRNDVSYDDITCMTIDELNKKKYYSESSSLVNIAIYNSRYENIKYSQTFDKILPYQYGRQYYYIADAIMFNKNYNIKNMDDVPHYLSLCKYYYDKENKSFNIDGWNIKFLDHYDKLNYEINYNVTDNMKNSKFPNYDWEKRHILRALLVIMNETPIEHINMNNYVMLGMYDNNHDLYLQNNERMIRIEKDIEVNKTNKINIRKNSLQLKINKLITRDEICNIICSQMCTLAQSRIQSVRKHI